MRYKKEIQAIYSLKACVCIDLANITWISSDITSRKFFYINFFTFNRFKLYFACNKILIFVN